MFLIHGSQNSVLFRFLVRFFTKRAVRGPTSLGHSILPSRGSGVPQHADGPLSREPVDSLSLVELLPGNAAGLLGEGREHCWGTWSGEAWK